VFGGTIALMDKKIVSLLKLPEYTDALLNLLIASVDEKATVLQLVGDLGAGKTTFVKALAKSMGIAEIVNSPTFVVMKIYYPTIKKNFERLVHIDAYRFEDSSEVNSLRLDTYFNDPKTLVCVEWPERLGNKLPKSLHSINIKIIDDNTREILYEKK
jgi:tRNA threonylcarbamoyladenosine biosynthesis protein TsaE